MVYIPHDEDEEEPEEEEKHSKKKHKKLSKKKTKLKSQTNQTNQTNQDEVKLRPGDIVITGSADSNVKIWSLHSGECFHVRISFSIHVQNSELI